MTDDTSDRFDDLLREGMRAYNRPPEQQDMPLDEMWTSIEAQTFRRSHRVARRAPWMGIAAALFIGVGIGRLSLYTGRVRSSAATTRLAVAGADSAQRPVTVNAAPS